MNTIRTAYNHVIVGAHRALQGLISAPCWIAGRRRMASTCGQGTVEYVGIVLVIGALLIALKTGMTGEATQPLVKAITNGVTGAIKTVIDGKS